MQRLASTLLISLFFITTLCVNSNAQEKCIELKNTATGKIRIIKNNTVLKVMWSSDSSEYSKVRVTSIGDNTISFTLLDEETKILHEVKISEIVKIRKPTMIHRVGYFIGGIFLLGGAYTLAEAPYIADENASNGQVMGIRGAGIAAIAVGLIPYLIKPETYSIGAGWQLSVVTK